jgi:hypothetical protein
MMNELDEFVCIVCGNELPGHLPARAIRVKILLDSLCPGATYKLSKWIYFDERCYSALKDHFAPPLEIKADGPQ